jgi:hypothetical protein
MRRRRFLGVCVLTTAAVLSIGCEPTAEDSLERLLAGTLDHEQAKHEFLLARERSVDPLLSAFDDPRFSRVHGQLVDVLFSLSMRVDDARIGDALARHLVDDPSADLRAAIAENATLYNRVDMAPSLLQALADVDARVRRHSLAGLGAMTSRLDSSQQQGLSEATRLLLRDPDADVRLEAQSRAASLIATWLAQARQYQLQAQLAEAESLHAVAIDYAPGSKQANYGLAWFYCETGQAKRGYDLLREHGLLLDVPRFPRAPHVDGRLDDEVWASAVRADSLYKFFWDSPAWAPPEGIVTHFLVGYTLDALYIGFHGHDDDPDSLVAKVTELDPTRDQSQGSGNLASVWSDDCIELMLDTDLDRQSFVHLGINSLGVRADEFFSRRPGADFSERWTFAADVGIATHVGSDFWSLEIALRFDRPHVPRPEPGDVWGFNLVRNYRGQQYLQWVRTYGSGLQPRDFGFLRFL